MAEQAKEQEPNQIEEGVTQADLGLGALADQLEGSLFSKAEVAKMDDGMEAGEGSLDDDFEEYDTMAESEAEEEAQDGDGEEEDTEEVTEDNEYAKADTAEVEALDATELFAKVEAGLGQLAETNKGVAFVMKAVTDLTKANKILLKRVEALEGDIATTPKRRKSGRMVVKAQAQQPTYQPQLPTDTLSQQDLKVALGQAASDPTNFTSTDVFRMEQVIQKAESGFSQGQFVRTFGLNKRQQESMFGVTHQGGIN